MTDSSTQVKAASDGGAATEKDVPAPRMHGMERLRENECYHLTNLIEDCLSEVQHLVRKVNGKAQGRISDFNGKKGTKPLDHDELAAILNEAYDCASQALSYIYSAYTHLRDQSTTSAEDAWVPGSLSLY